jgi:hypothetical protein
MQDLAGVIVVACIVSFTAGVALVSRGIIRARAERREDAVRWAIGRMEEDAHGLVVGEVQSSACTVIAPLSGRPCVYYRVRVSELRARSGFAARHHLTWEPLIDEQHGVEFLLDDGTGRVRIDPTRASIDLRTVWTRVNGSSSPVNRHEAALLRRHRLTELDGLGRRRRLRFEEIAIEVGQQVAAIGCGERDADTSTTDLWGLRPASTPLRMTAPRILDPLAVA